MTLYGARGEAGGPEMPDGISVHDASYVVTDDTRTFCWQHSRLFFWLVNSVAVLLTLSGLVFLVWWLFDA